MWRRPIEALVRRMDQVEDSHVTRGRGRPRKTRGKIVKRDLNVNGLNIYIYIYDRALWLRLIHVADLTL